MEFIQHIVNYLIEQDLALNQVTIVLPSERPKKYIQKALFQHYKKPILSPKMVTMDKWIKDLNKEHVVDKTRLSLILYRIFLEDPTNDFHENYAQFLNYGNSLINDYDEIDRYLLDANQVFKNLSDIKEIENWSFNSSEFTEAQKKFMEFWDRLPNYYHQLNAYLQQKGQIYSGKAYRYVAENIQCIFEANKNQHFIFAGFNALSAAETLIMKQLHKMGRGHLLFDVDAFYMNKPMHEAGLFIKKNLKNIDLNLKPYPNAILGKEKKITFFECNYQTDQIKVLASILDDQSIEENQETLILLADEKLINPLIENLPKKIEKANITLGLPLSQTVAKSWMELFFSIQNNKSFFKTEAIYTKDLFDFLNHPFIHQIIDESAKEAIYHYEQKLIQKNAVFKNFDSLKLPKHIQLIFQKLCINWNMDWKLAIQLQLEVIHLIHDEIKEENEYEIAVLQHMHQACVELINLFEESLPPLDFVSFKQIFNTAWSKKRIAYHGNPIEGLQIMGLLETRLLDFKTIYCLGLTEGVMPPDNPIQTMIPMDLRKYLNLPTPRDKQGLFAHHFYRLLHHTNHFCAFYSKNTLNGEDVEKSRYLMQLELELLKESEKTTQQIQFEKIQFEIIHQDSEEQVVTKKIEKDEHLLKRIHNFLEHDLSFSVLNQYKNCPSNFYFTYLLNFGESNQINEELERNQIGSIIHQTLENLYQPYNNDGKETKRVLTVNSIEAMEKIAEKELNLEFQKAFDNDASIYQSGINFLQFEEAKSLLRKFLAHDKKIVQANTVFIESLEKTYYYQFEINIHEVPTLIKLKGTIDRVEHRGDTIYLIDYKSGSYKELKGIDKIGSYEGFKKSIEKQGHNYLLQLLIYAILFQKQDKSGKKIVAQTVFLNKLKAEEQLVGYDQIPHLEEYLHTYIGEIVQEMCDPNVPFEHNSKSLYCNYCT